MGGSNNNNNNNNIEKKWTRNTKKNTQCQNYKLKKQNSQILKFT